MAASLGIGKAQPYAVTRGYHLFAKSGNQLRVLADWAQNAVTPAEATSFVVISAGSVPLDVDKPRAWSACTLPSPCWPPPGGRPGAGPAAAPATSPGRRPDAVLQFRAASFRPRKPQENCKLRPLAFREGGIEGDRSAGPASGGAQ